MKLRDARARKTPGAHQRASNSRLRHFALLWNWFCFTLHGSRLSIEKVSRDFVFCITAFTIFRKRALLIMAPNLQRAEQADHRRTLPVSSPPNSDNCRRPPDRENGNRERQDHRVRGYQKKPEKESHRLRYLSHE